jgi:seryl-tRNA synthetase
MIDPDFIRKQPAAAIAAFARRGFAFDHAAWTALDEARRRAAQAFEAAQAERNRLAEATAQAERNRLAEATAQAKRQGAGGAELVAAGERAKLAAEGAKAAFEQVDKAWRDAAMRLPNLPAADVPDGKGEADNKVRRQVGTPPQLDFDPKPHEELGALHRGLDFEAGAALAGSRFVVASGPIARLHRALIQFMLDTHVDEHGYLEVQTPYLVKASALEGTGQLPKFEEDLFKLERDGLYLIPTAEVPVTNLLATMDAKAADLPLAFACHTPCFRREAGSAGRDVKGLIRQHQFEKVELVRACDPADAPAQFDAILAHAEAILARLGLPYRVVDLCAGDLGFSSERTVDLEVWLPGQDAWREISSVSTFGEFQARRMGAKFKDAAGKRRHLATLNGSGLAAGRALVAVLENFQTPDGSIVVPEALRPYMKGVATLAAPRPPERKARP